MLTGVIALNERDLGAVGTPLDRLGSAAGDSAFGKDFSMVRFCDAVWGLVWACAAESRICAWTARRAMIFLRAGLK